MAHEPNWKYPALSIFHIRMPPMSDGIAAKKTGTRFTRVAVSDYQIMSASLLVDYGVVREVKVIGARPIEVDPTLCHFATATDSHRQRRGPVCRYCYAGGHGGPVIARAQGSSIPDARDRSTEGIRGKFRNRDAERFVSTSRVGQCDRNRVWMAVSNSAKTCRYGIQ